MLGLNTSGLDEFYSSNGLNKLFDYDLTDESKILELGGYDGTWISKMIDKYNPIVYAIEPIKEFYDDLRSKFSENNKFQILNVGISDFSHDGLIYLNGDSTSAYSENAEKRLVSFKTMADIFELFGLEHVDVLQINIEGEEYKLLEHMISTGIVNKFSNIQVQFHTGIEDYESRRNTIHDGLRENGFISSFEYPFIWEGWKKIKMNNL
jgi:FkbM family methyltransferase